MSTRKSTIDFIVDQLASLKNIRVQKMFGEYALYCDEKVTALVCDDQMFVKITDAGKQFIGPRYEEGCAYPGAKPSMRIGADDLEDADRLSELVRVTANALPIPKAKAKKRTPRAEAPDTKEASSRRNATRSEHEKSLASSRTSPSSKSPRKAQPAKPASTKERAKRPRSST